MRNWWLWVLCRSLSKELAIKVPSLFLRYEECCQLHLNPALGPWLCNNLTIEGDHVVVLQQQAQLHTSKDNMYQCCTECCTFRNQYIRLSREVAGLALLLTNAVTGALHYVAVNN